MRGLGADIRASIEKRALTKHLLALLTGTSISGSIKCSVGALRMPIFQVLRRVDAFVDYLADIEADSAEEAAAKANEDESLFDWKEVDVCQFDARLFVALDENGDEIEGTQHGDF